jgi:plastocyanin
MTAAGLASVVIGAALLASCGGGGSSGDDSGGLTNVNISQGTPKPLERPEQVIEVGDSAFNPNDVTIKVGTKVIWKWTGTTACAIQLAGVTAPEQSSGTYEQTFDSGGVSFSYQCAGKSGFVGKITVE